MKILVAANKVPFMPGGADYHINGLVSALQAFGHEVELLQLPFRFSPESEVQRAMDNARGSDVNRPNGVSVDALISLQFPAYGMQHDNHRAWVMHQHRAVYELYEQQPGSDALAALKASIADFDIQSLENTQALFANSRRVAERLKQFNGLDAEPLYHPPHGAGQFFCEDPWDYFFVPSRLESLKRQDLVIRAAAHMKSGAKILIGGDGGQRPQYQQLIADLKVGDRVQLIGRFTEAEKRVLYARALGVVFVPQDEDYGYITLEAMLSSKPVITCTDSGGPLEFVVNGETGRIVSPEPEQLAEAMDDYWHRKQRAAAMGMAGREQLQAKNISWTRVVERLLA